MRATMTVPPLACPRCAAPNPALCIDCTPCRWLLTTPYPPAAPTHATVPGSGGPPAVSTRTASLRRDQPPTRPPHRKWAAVVGLSLLGAVSGSALHWGPALRTFLPLATSRAVVPRRALPLRDAAHRLVQEHYHAAFQAGTAGAVWAASGTFNSAAPVIIPVVAVNGHTGTRITTYAEIDSGSYYTMITTTLAQQLELTRSGQTLVSGVTGTAAAPVYAPSLVLTTPQGQVLWTRSHPEGLVNNLLPSGAQILLGRDLLSQSGTAFTTTAQTWRLTVQTQTTQPAPSSTKIASTPPRPTPTPVTPPTVAAGSWPGACPGSATGPVSSRPLATAQDAVPPAPNALAQEYATGSAPPDWQAHQPLGNDNSGWYYFGPPNYVCAGLSGPAALRWIWVYQPQHPQTAQASWAWGPGQAPMGPF